MTKRMGFAVGLLLAAVGVGTPAVAVASSDNVATAPVVVTNTIEEADTTSQGWTHGDEYAIGIDPFAGFVEPSAPRTTFAALNDAEAFPQRGPDVASGDSTRALPNYGIGLAEANAYGMDPYGGFTEPGPAIREAAVATHGLTRVEPDALGVNGSGGTNGAYSPPAALTSRAGDHRDADDVLAAARPYGGEATSTRTAASSVAASDAGLTFGLKRVELSAWGVDPTGGRTTDLRFAAVDSNDWDANAIGFDPYGGVVETAGRRS